MKWLWFAYKNIIRNLRRSLITMLIIAVGTASTLITSGFILYTYDSLQEISVRDSGHIVIAHKKYFDKEEETSLYGLADHKSIKQQIEQQNEEIQMVIPRLQFSGLIVGILVGNRPLRIFLGALVPEPGFIVHILFTVESSHVHVICPENLATPLRHGHRPLAIFAY